MNAGLSPNYFDIFGLPVDFKIDEQLLAEHYRELQKTVHPDRFANASERDRRMAVQQAADINEAFHTLKSPLKRARYLLQIKGVAFDDEKETTVEPAFLMEQMELREALAEVSTSEDAFAKLNSIMQDIAKSITQMLEEYNECVKIGDFSKAKAIVQKLQFLEKLKIESEILEEELANAI
jgi:molecular chaperone HscB